jgi:hypothetical protein
MVSASPEGAPTSVPTQEAVPEHRERLAEAARRLHEQAGADMVEPPRWMEEYRAEVLEVIDALVLHIDETEGEGGLYDEIMADKPRLAHAIDVLGEEHLALLADASAIMGVAAVATRAIDEARLRDGAAALVHHIERHQRRGLKLLYDFYDVDIGVGE